MPTYNRAGFLEGTLGSIFGQTVDVHEVLLIDDGSTDDTLNVVTRLFAAHPDWKDRLRYVAQENRGKSVALNLGLTLAAGDWIAFNDSDDQWLPGKLALQFAALGEFEEAGACFTDVRYVNDPAITQTAFQAGMADRESPFGIKHNVARLFSPTWPFVYMQTLLVSRAVMEKSGGFDTTIRMSMDSDFTFRLGFVTPMCYVNQPLVEVDRTPSRTIGLTTEYPITSLDRLKVEERLIKKWLSMPEVRYLDLRRRLKAKLRRTCSALANNYLVRGEFVAARAILAKAVREDPDAGLVAKLLWSTIAPRSLAREIRRRDRARRA